jgi:hypothetical protein
MGKVAEDKKKEVETDISKYYANILNLINNHYDIDKLKGWAKIKN